MMIVDPSPLAKVFGPLFRELWNWVMLRWHRFHSTWFGWSRFFS